MATQMTNSRSAHSQELEEKGYTILRQALSLVEVSRLLDLVSHYYQLTSSVVYEGVPARDCDDKIVYGLPCKDYAFLKPIFSKDIESLILPVLNDPYYRYLPPDIANYYLAYYNARSSGKKLDLHIDSHIPSPGTHCWSMQVAIALEPMTVENGCTVVVPGSHRSGTYTDRESKDLVDLTLNPGDIAIWDSRLWHGTRENKTISTRWALIATFTSWWVKPAMDYTKSLPQEIYHQLSNKEKALLGFCSIPPINELSGINTKKGFADLKDNVQDYQGI